MGVPGPSRDPLPYHLEPENTSPERYIEASHALAKLWQQRCSFKGS